MPEALPEPVHRAEPIRAFPPPGRRCWCVLVDPDERARKHRCPAPQPNPDAPFCEGCETRHPDLARLGIIVTTWWAARL